MEHNAHVVLDAKVCSPCTYLNMITSSSDQCTAPPEPEQLAQNILLEEESFSWYDPAKLYPVHVGEVFESRYKVLVKLGYGSVSTAWLCRDLRYLKQCFASDKRLTRVREQCYVTLNVYMTGHRQAVNEVKVTNHLRSIRSDHPGSTLMRRMLATFEVQGEGGSHVCLVYYPLS